MPRDHRHPDDDPREEEPKRYFTTLICGLFVAGSLAPCGSDDDDTATTDAPTEIESPVRAAVDAFTEAINTYDTEALLAVTTEDFVWTSTGDPMTRDEFVTHFEANYEVTDFNVEPTSELIITDAASGAYAGEQRGEVTSDVYNATGTSSYEIVDVDGTWLVDEFVRVEEGTAVD